MAKKTIFQPIDLNKYEELEFDKSCLTTYGIPTDPHAIQVESMLFTECPVDHEKLVNILETPTTDDLSNLTKAFILPGMEISMDRLKEALKEHSISVTNDYEKADCIVTNEYVNDSHDSKFRTNKLMHQKDNMNMLKDGIPGIKKYYDKTGNYTLYCDKINGADYPLWNLDYEEAGHYDLYGISGLAIELAHKIKYDALEVIDVDTVMNSSSSKQILTKELLDQLVAMLRGDSDDKALAAKILPTIDIKTNVHFLWDLCQQVGTTIQYDFNRNKDVQWWADKAGIRSLGHKNAEQAIKYLAKKEQLTSEGFRFLEPICREQISISNRELYSFKVQVKPEWRKYFNKKKVENE